MNDERIGKLERSMIKIEKDIEYMKKDIDDIKQQISEFIKSAEKKYAPKYIEQVFWWCISVVGTIILGAIIGMILI